MNKIFYGEVGGKGSPKTGTKKGTSEMGGIGIVLGRTFPWPRRKGKTQPNPGDRVYSVGPNSPWCTNKREGRNRSVGGENRFQRFGHFNGKMGEISNGPETIEKLSKHPEDGAAVRKGALP